MNSLKSHNEYNKIALASPLKKISLNGEQYTIFWTTHARNRAQRRGNSSEVILNTMLVNTLRAISKLKQFQKIDGYVTIRDFFTRQFSVLNICREKKEIRVISCADINFYPHEGDLYIQRNENNTVKIFVWKHKEKKEP